MHQDDHDVAVPAVAPNAGRAAARADAFARVDAVAADAARAERVPAVAWGVVLDGGLVHDGGLGACTVTGGPLPDRDTRFRIASMTKSFTAATVLALRDDGLLGLDEPVIRYVPQVAAVPLPTVDSPEVTLRHLLSMDAGFATDDAWADRHLDIARNELDALLASGLMFATPPGTAFEYSNLGYALLGRVVERVTGRPYRQVVDERFLAPLGMTDTGWDVPSGDGVGLARGYRLLDGGVGDDGDPLAHGDIAAMGGLWSTVADLARWVAFFLDAFPARDDPDDGPLRRSSRREMQRVWRSLPVSIDRTDPERPCLTRAGYGAGVSLVDDESIGTIVGHSGGVPGFGSNMSWVPDRGIGVISLGNLRYAPMAALNRRVLNALAAEGHLDDLAPRRSPAVSPILDGMIERLVALLNDWDDESARALFADNVEPDDAFDRRAAHARAVVTRTGALRVRSVEAPRATSATVVLAGERGGARLELALAPIVPTLVQSYELTRIAS